MKTKLEHRYLLKKAIELIEDSLDPQTTSDPKVISTWLSVAGDYCKDAAESLKESIKG